MISPYTTKGAATPPQMIAAQGSTTEQPAVIETRPGQTMKYAGMMSRTSDKWLGLAPTLVASLTTQKSHANVQQVPGPGPVVNQD